ncbi:MAG TPA: DUF4157 domain-containing protein [Steroidobacteraceae bacterium]|nr:DUF4157 domain-containing protein [Steroidobacteraceae bacterium]
MNRKRTTVRVAPMEPAAHASKPMFEAQNPRAPSFFDSSPAMQTKFTMSESGDRFEREADAVADAVVPASGGGATVSESVQRGVAAQSGAGHALDAPVRQDMEQGIGADFSGVRIHTGAPASELNDSLHARAFTHGQDVFFNAGEFNPGSSGGRHLLAHELTHVVQQSRSTGGVPSMQRAPAKPGSAADKLQKSKDALKSKYGLKDLSEQNGVVWTESLVRKLGGHLAKMKPDEQERLRGVTFTLTDKFPSKTLKGTTFPVAGTTYGTFLIELTANGVQNTTLHEVGHLLHHHAIANAEKLLARSQAKFDLEIARGALLKDGRFFFKPLADEPYLEQQMNAVISAASKFEKSSDANRKANRDALDEALMLLPMIKPDASQPDLAPHVERLRAFGEALLKYGEEEEKVVGSIKRLDEFVGIVKKGRLDRPSVIFTPYAKANWPESPAEFFSEAYEVWRGNPAAVKRVSPDLVAWFEKGGHLGPKIPPPRKPIKLTLPEKAPGLQEKGVTIDQFFLRVGDMFLPAVEGGANMVDMVLPLPLPREK